MHRWTSVGYVYLHRWSCALLGVMGSTNRPLRERHATRLYQQRLQGAELMRGGRVAMLDRGQGECRLRFQRDGQRLNGGNNSGWTALAWSRGNHGWPLCAFLAAHAIPATATATTVAVRSKGRRE